MKQMSEDDRDYAEYGFDPDIKEHEGFSVGDQVEIIESEGDTILVGEEGTVIGFIDLPAATDPDLALAYGNDPRARIAVYVLFDGEHEPVEVRPSHMEVA